MKNDSLSKLVSRAPKLVVDAKNATSAVGKSISSSVSKSVKSGSKFSSETYKKIESVCNTENIVPCITILLVIIYMIVLSPETVLNIFSTQVGKSITMVVVFVALLFDVKLGVMLGLAAVLSINMASVKKEVHESYRVSESMPSVVPVKKVPKVVPEVASVEVPEFEKKEEDMGVLGNVDEMNVITGYDNSEVFASLVDTTEIMS
tara:strand:+ start:5083 stop:5697 length:615 start_codon:yes stop_codon:yes gene_type:complete